VTLEAQPAAGSAFLGWTGACTGGGACQVRMDAAEEVGARFATLYGLTVRVTGSGTVTSRPAGIACPRDCMTQFAQGAAVGLAAKAKKGFRFAGWTGACSGKGACTVRLAGSRTVRATFRRA
jgi:endoglucanase